MADRSWTTRKLRLRSSGSSRAAGENQYNNESHRTQSPNIENNSNNQAHVSVNNGSTFWDAIAYHKQESAPLHAAIKDLKADQSDLVQALEQAEADFDAQQKRIGSLSLRRTFSRLAIGLTLGSFFAMGAVVSWTLHPEANAVAAVLPTPTITVTAPPALDLDEALPSPDPGVFSSMSCSTSQWVAFLETTSGKYADRAIALDLISQNARATNILKSGAPEIFVGKYADICPTARDYVEGADPSRYFMWIGPLASEGDASRACAALGKPEAWDCYPRATT